MDKKEYEKIARRISTDILKDEGDRSEWLAQTKEVLELANQTKTEKTFPWTGASNIKLPLVLDAAIKFATRAYPEIIPNGEIVKASYTKDAERAKRVTSYMSWQLLENETNWEADTDKLLHMLPIVGHMFRKRFYCVSKQRTDSELIMPDKMICSEDGRRKTHIIIMPHSEVLSRQRSGEWRDDVELRDIKDVMEEQETYEIHESHTWLDLDGDGYEEPVIVVLWEDKILDISPRYEAKDVYKNAKGEIVRIEETCYIIEYTFIPNFTGGYYGVGFGQLLMPLTMAANSLMNQLVDAGTLANVQGGFISDKVKILSGKKNFEIGEWKKVSITNMNSTLAQEITPLPVKEPSQTLFSLLGLIIELTKELGSIKDILSGDTPASNMPATTTVALIEQGMKTFNAIYKRIYRSLRNEFKLLYKLNGQYLDMKEYFNFNDQENAIFQEDFESTGLDIIPQADPNLSSDMQRLSKAEALRQMIGQPGVDPKPILTMYLRALRIEEEMIEQILPPPPPPQEPAPDPKMLEMIQKLEIEQAKLKIKEDELAIERAKLAMQIETADYKNVETETRSIQNLAIAESMEVGQQLDIYKTQTEGILNEQRVEAPSSDPRVPQPTQRASRPVIGGNEPTEPGGA